MYNMTWHSPLLKRFLVRSLAQNVNFSYCSAGLQVLRERDGFRNRCLAITGGVSETLNISNCKANWSNTLEMDLLKTWNMSNYSVHKNVSVQVITVDFLIEELRETWQSLLNGWVKVFEIRAGNLWHIKYAVHWTRLSDVICCYWTRILERKKD